MNVKELSRLVTVLVIGFLFGSGLTPLHAEDPVTGEILKVCINTKSGAIRVANKCANTERKTVLGGVGAKGDKGDTGATGEKGETGATGATGATGTVSGLRTQTIKFLQEPYSIGGGFCLGSYSVVTGVSSYYDSFLKATNVTATKGYLNSCSMTVYAP